MVRGIARTWIIAVVLVCLAAGGGEAWAQTAGQAQPPPDPDAPPKFYEEVVVTASAKAEPLGQTATTMQVLDRATIEASNAATVTELLAARGVAYFGEWSPSQTSINLRGAATDGQGRDFRSQVVVLINGRRAGTANLSKLSLQSVDRIEIVRGPGSLVYGSQAIGGVINLITRSGVRGAEQSVSLNTGSWGQIDAGGQFSGVAGKLDYAVGAHGGRRGDYDAGRDSAEKMINTAYAQRGAAVDLGYTRSSREHLSFGLRTDGIYNAGFRGSQWDIDNEDTRYNQSADAVYTRASSNDNRSFTGHYYFFRDVDDFRWGTEVIRLGNGLPGPGFDQDNNYRVNSGHGVKARASVAFSKNATLLGGADTEWSRLRNRRDRRPVPGGATTQVAPFDNNSDTWTGGVFAEQVQRVGGDRVTLRGGVRFDRGDQAIKATPNQPLLNESTATVGSLTYRAAATARVTSAWTIRGGVGSGFRAPTASELTANYVTVQGGQILGNANLSPEKTVSVDVGTLVERGPLSLDVDLFQSRIRDRIATVPIDQNRTQFVNRGASDITGLEIQTRVELGRLGTRSVRFWTGVNGYYHFVMRDNDAAARNLNSDRIDRMNQYQASVQVGGRGDRGWTGQLTGSLSGPLWYATEENLLIPQVVPVRGYILRKDPFSLWNLAGSYPLGGGVRVRAAVNNLLNANVHPTFFSIDAAPYLSDPRFSNGGRGNSAPGRGFLIGLGWSGR